MRSVMMLLAAVLLATAGGCVTATYSDGDGRELQIQRFGLTTQIEGASVTDPDSGRVFELKGYRSEAQQAMDLATEALNRVP